MAGGIVKEEERVTKTSTLADWMTEVAIHNRLAEVESIIECKHFNLLLIDQNYCLANASLTLSIIMCQNLCANVHVFLVSWVCVKY